jgi:putative hydrolase of the HAD superfamily
MIKVILFDLDDTLISEKEFVNDRFEYLSFFIAKKYFLSTEIVIGTLHTLFQESPLNVFNRFFDYIHISYSKEDIDLLVKKYREEEVKVKYFDDVLPTIIQLKNKKIKLGIISDGNLSTQKNKIKCLKTEDYFDKIILTDEFGKKFWKPNPKAFEMMKDYFNVSYDQIAYVGDNPEKDFYIGKLFPITTIRIQRENSLYEKRRYYQDVREEFRIETMNELLQLCL